MKRNFEIALAHVFRWEGGFVDDGHDPGGATNFGITWRTYRRWHRDHKWYWPGKIAMRTLTKETAAAIYQRYYWNECNCSNLPPGIDLAVFDGAVNQGPKRTAKLLQRAAGSKADGDIGPKTLKAVAGKPNIIRDFMARRAVHYSGLANIMRYGYGWFRRLFDTHEMALIIKRIE